MYRYWWVPDLGYQARPPQGENSGVTVLDLTRGDEEARCVHGHPFEGQPDQAVHVDRSCLDGMTADEAFDKACAKGEFEALAKLDCSHSFSSPPDIGTTRSFS